MTPSSDIFVEDVPASLQRWTYDALCMVCWSMLGAWAVESYPDAEDYLTESVTIRNVTYCNSAGTVFSGYADDGRIWYMKKKIMEGHDVDHAQVLVFLYPKSEQNEVTEFINIVKNW